MVFTTDRVFANRRALRGKLGQTGFLNSAGLEFRPIGARLRLYERMARQDTSLKTGLRDLVNIIVGTIGEVYHPDGEVKDFLNYNLSALEDEHGRAWRDALFEAQWTMLWAGYDVSEPMFDLEEGQMRLGDLVSYHPLSIILRPDLQGRLSEGKPTRTEKKSGIYQLPFNVPGKEEIQLPLWKTIYIGNDNEYGNWYGHSILSPAYKWYRFKEAITDMFAIALSKLGRRLLWVRTPSYATDQVRVDPATGIEHPITTLDLVREQIEADEEFGDALLLPQQQPEMKPEVGSTPLGDQFGDAYLEALRFADQMALREIIPYFLLADVTELEKAAIERRMEVFYYALEFRRNKLLRPVARKALMPLVHWNYNRESAKVMPEFTKVYSDRPEDRVATMQMVKGLTENGYLNPRNTVDWSVVRQMVRVAEREMDKDDLKFIKEILIDPHKKAQPASGTQRGTQGSGREGRPTGDTTPQQESRERNGSEA